MASTRFTLLVRSTAALGCRAVSAPTPEAARSFASVLQLGRDALAVDQWDTAELLMPFTVR